MKHLSLLIAAFALVLSACERHSWEDVTDADGNITEKGTKRLFESHGGHEGGADHAGHDEDAKPPVAHDHDADGKSDH